MYTSKHKGIYYIKEKEKWIARIMISGKNYNFGRFDTEQEAIEEYKAGVEKLKKQGVEIIHPKSKKRPVFPRNKNGMIERICERCGKIDEFKKVPISKMCKSCGVKKSFENRPGVGFKDAGNIETIMEEYNNGDSLAAIGKRREVCASCISNNMKKNGYRPRNYNETGTFHKTQQRMLNRVREMCRTGEFQRNRSAMLQGIPIEEWEGFITPENKKFYASPEYKDWRISVFDRDNYTCQKCGVKDCRIEAHHIKPKCKFLELRLDINNGITLCHPCHCLTKNREQDFEEEFFNILKNKCIIL